MGHEAILYGIIEGRPYRSEQYYKLHDLNAEVISRLPETDEWPFLVKGMFAIPANYPYGKYRAQIIHFGASLKDEPGDISWLYLWISKFENLLKELYWFQAKLYVDTEFFRPFCFVWNLTDEAVVWYNDPDNPKPSKDWERHMFYIDENVKDPEITGYPEKPGNIAE